MHRSSGEGPLQRAPGSPTHQHESCRVPTKGRARRSGAGQASAGCRTCPCCLCAGCPGGQESGGWLRGRPGSPGCHKPQGPSLENSSPPLANSGPQPVQGPWVSGQAQETRTPHSLPTSFRRASMRFPLETEKSDRRGRVPQALPAASTGWPTFSSM